MTTLGDKLFGFLRGDGPEHSDLQAGGPALSLQDTVQTFMRTPGHLLAILRLYSRQPVAEVAAATGMSEATLNSYEKGDSAPTLPHLTKLAAHYKADLRKLLVAFGHVSTDASEQSYGLAAQFGGELTAAEKMDLKAVMQAFADQNKPK